MRRASTRRAERSASVPLWTGPQREHIALRDLADCLLEAYDSVAHRAHEIYLERGAQSGGELDDWLAAERELLHDLSVHVEDSARCVYASAYIPRMRGAVISVGIESSWLAIVVHPEATVVEGAEAIPAELHECFPDAEDDAPAAREEAPVRFGKKRVSAARAFSIQQLPAPVDRTRSVAVFSKGVLGIRMPKLTLANKQ